MPSRTALVLANQGDPIFGAIARGLFRGARGIIRGVRGIITRGRETAIAVRGSTEVARRVGQVTTIARSRPARVLAGLAATGGAAAIGVRLGTPAGAAAGFQVQDGFVIGAGGCPTGKVVEVAAHQRIIPLDRFGRPRRRIDVLNTKALSRATRRLGGFQKRARRVEKQLARIAPRSRSRRRSKGVC